MRFVLWIVPFISALFMSCAVNHLPMNDAPEMYDITLERTSCRGNCPVYSMTIHGDGTVEYEGFLNVPFKGKRFGIISKDSVVALMSMIRQLNVHSLLYQYARQDKTDMPTVLFTILYKHEGIIRGKSITDYLGDETAPKDLRALYARMDEWYGIIQWQ